MTTTEYYVIAGYVCGIIVTALFLGYTDKSTYDDTAGITVASFMWPLMLAVVVLLGLMYFGFLKPTSWLYQKGRAIRARRNRDVV